MKSLFFSIVSMIDNNILGMGAIGEELGGLAAILDFLISQMLQQLKKS